ncbi:MAG: hypothetical protein GX103_03475 [Bacteroidales bacterium]|nr:hypothetical protein [Bacteroidales bacterium]
MLTIIFHYLAQKHRIAVFQLYYPNSIFIRFGSVGALKGGLPQSIVARASNKQHQEEAMENTGYFYWHFLFAFLSSDNNSNSGKINFFPPLPTQSQPFSFRPEIRSEAV